MDNKTITTATATVQPAVALLRNMKDPAKPAITHYSTGITGLDAATDGGWTPRTVSAICGAPSVGKTTLALQLAAHVASIGLTTIYLSTEMSSERIAAIITSCASHIADPDFPATANDILSSDYVGRNRLLDAASADIASLWVAGSGSWGHRAEEITPIIDGLAKSSDKSPVVVIVDYLQDLCPDRHMSVSPDTGNKTVVDNAMHLLRDIADTYNAIVVAVCAVQRDYYNPNTAISLSSLRDSSHLDYGLDLLLGLKQHNRRPSTSFFAGSDSAASVRDMDLQVIKQRYGEIGGTVRLTYYPRYNHFTDTAPTDSGHKNLILGKHTPGPIQDAYTDDCCIVAADDIYGTSL